MPRRSRRPTCCCQRAHRGPDARTDPDADADADADPDADSERDAPRLRLPPPWRPPVGAGVEPPEPIPASACSATYTVVNHWTSDGQNWFQAEVVVTAGSSGVDGWAVSWALPQGVQISTVWNARLGTSGSTATAENMGWNGTPARRRDHDVRLPGDRTGRRRPAGPAGQLLPDALDPQGLTRTSAATASRRVRAVVPRPADGLVVRGRVEGLRRPRGST